MIYDIIGDIHGQADKLIGLLTQLGYRHDGVSYVAPDNHKVIFIGDLIDRGNRQLDTLQIVFDMLDNHQAYAIMGNHEYNAIAYATQDKNGHYLRPHTTHNTIQHQAFLNELPFGSDLHQYWLSRLYELPLWLELDDFICIHACYDATAMTILSPLLNHNRLTPHALQHTATSDTAEFIALERLLKGIEAKLPQGITMTDKTGIVRHNARVKWWIHDWQHKAIDVTLFAQNLPSHHLANLAEDLLNFAINTDKPIFIGHYWLGGKPQILSNQVVCVDYSAGKDGFLTAYQFDTDKPRLSDDNFIQYIHTHIT